MESPPAPMLSSRALKPNTPVSNRKALKRAAAVQTAAGGLVADVSFSLDGEDMFGDDSDDDAAPAEFSLDLFPPTFRSGSRAGDLLAVWSVVSESDTPVSASQVARATESVNINKAQLLLDMLTSRQLLRAMAVGNELYWEKRR